SAVLSAVGGVVLQLLVGHGLLLQRHVIAGRLSRAVDAAGTTGLERQGCSVGAKPDFMGLDLLSVAAVLPLLTVAALVAAGAWMTPSGFRWGPLPGAFISAAYLVFLLVGNPYPINHLGHPKDLFAVSIAIILLFGLATLTFGVCLAASASHLRGLRL